MRKGFTLIELMIVIAIIAIIAAIAIPSLLESRITANEAAAADSLKSGMFPGQTQFQAGAYIDIDNDGRGTYAPHVACLAGASEPGVTAATAALNIGSLKSLKLIDPKYANYAGLDADHQSVTLDGSARTTACAVGAYYYYVHTNITGAGATEDNCESYFGMTATPAKDDGSECRRAFGMNGTGSIMQSKQTVTEAQAANVGYIGADNTGAVAATSMFSTSPISALPVPGANGSPYQK